MKKLATFPDVPLIRVPISLLLRQAIHFPGQLRLRLIKSNSSIISAIRSHCPSIGRVLLPGKGKAETAASPALRDG